MVVSLLSVPPVYADIKQNVYEWPAWCGCTPNYLDIPIRSDHKEHNSGEESEEVDLDKVELTDEEEAEVILENSENSEESEVRERRKNTKRATSYQQQEETRPNLETPNDQEDHVRDVVHQPPNISEGEETRLTEDDSSEAREECATTRKYLFCARPPLFFLRILSIFLFTCVTVLIVIFMIPAKHSSVSF